MMNFNDAIGKPISFLVSQINEFELESLASTIIVVEAVC